MALQPHRPTCVSSLNEVRAPLETRHSLFRSSSPSASPIDREPDYPYPELESDGELEHSKQFSEGFARQEEEEEEEDTEEEAEEDGEASLQCVCFCVPTGG